MTVSPLRIKNSQTAARAVLNIMAHYGMPPLSYKVGTFAGFMLLAVRVFTEDRRTALRLEERIYDILQSLQTVPHVKPVGVMLERALKKSDLTLCGRSWSEVTVADLLFLSGSRNYRYTKIVGSQEFKARIDTALIADLQDIEVTAGVSPVALSMMLAQMVKFDLYSHFYVNAPATLSDLSGLKPLEKATLYLAFKSFLMAKQDVFDPGLQALGIPLGSSQVEALQRFLQIQGIYRFSDWFPQASDFLSGQYLRFREECPEVPVTDLALGEPDEIWSYLQLRIGREKATQGRLRPLHDLSLREENLNRTS